MGFNKRRGTNLLEEIVTTAKEVFPEVIEEKKPEVIEEKKPEVIEEKKPEVIEEKKPVVKKPEVKKPAKKQREDTKVIINCGIKGDTIEVRDFRAIVKKKGLQINVVLNGIIAEWNHNNYNL